MKMKQIECKPQTTLALGEASISLPQSELCSLCRACKGGSCSQYVQTKALAPIATRQPCKSSQHGMLRSAAPSSSPACLRGIFAHFIPFWTTCFKICADVAS